MILVLERNPDRRVKVVDDRQDIKNHEAQANDDGNCPADGCTYPIWENRVAGHSYNGEDDDGSQYLQGKREQGHHEPLLPNPDGEREPRFLKVPDIIRN